MNLNGSANDASTRQKYVAAWNDTLITMWQEQITLLGVIDTGALLNNLKKLSTKADPDFFEITIRQQFLEYGIWQEYGVGKESPRGNPGDIGRQKVRQRRRWFTRKYYQSAMAIKDFLADNIGKSFIGIISDALNDKTLKALAK